MDMVMNHCPNICMLMYGTTADDVQLSSRVDQFHYISYESYNMNQWRIQAEWGGGQRGTFSTKCNIKFYSKRKTV